MNASMNHLALRRVVLAVLATSPLLFPGGAWAQEAAGKQPLPAAVKEVLLQALGETVEGNPAAVSLVEVSYPPGGASEPHRHPGPVVGYVLEGAIEFQADDGPLRTIHAGEGFFEPAHALHRVSRNASNTRPARFLAYMLVREGDKRLVLPAD